MIIYYSQSNDTEEQASLRNSTDPKIIRIGSEKIRTIPIDRKDKALKLGIKI